MPRLLIVDDAQTIRESLSDLLTSNGFEVVEADNGEQGLEMLAQYAVDMVISDLNMPGMDGLTMCQHIKEQGYTMPIFMLTTQANPELKAKAKDFGVVVWIVKPYKDATLLQGIRKVLKL
ncbi:MAG: response regulator [Pseudomonadota bacterium]